MDYKLVGTTNVAIDLDKTLLHTNWQRWMREGMEYFGDPRPGAITFLKYLRDQEYYIIIHTCRVNPEANPGFTVKELEKLTAEALDSKGLIYDEIWTDRGKPVAKWYIDDSGIRFEGDFADILAKYFEK